MPVENIPTSSNEWMSALWIVFSYAKWKHLYIVTYATFVESHDFDESLSQNFAMWNFEFWIDSCILELVPFWCCF